MRTGTPILLLAVALLLTASGRPSPAAAQASGARAVCVLTNPAYAGKCTQVTEVGQGSTPRKACEAVLACLNSTGCLKTYCDATTIRSGWKLESVQPASK